MRVIALTDCSKAYATIGSIAVNSTERSMGILLAYVRDSLFPCVFAFVGAIFNLPDVATKTNGNVGIYDRSIYTGRFLISFLGRIKSKLAAQDNVQ